MLLFYLISIIKLFLSQSRGFMVLVFFSEFPPHSTKGEQADVRHFVTCLSSTKERSSRRTFHVIQAGGPPWREGCLVPEGDSCARDDFLWAKECAATYRSRQSPMHIIHMVDICRCSTPSSCASSLLWMTWRDEGVPTVDEVVCKLWEYKENLSSYPWTCLSVVKKNLFKKYEKQLQEFQQQKEDRFCSPPAQTSISAIESITLLKKEDKEYTTWFLKSCGTTERIWKNEMENPPPPRGMGMWTARKNNHKCGFFQENSCSSFQQANPHKEWNG